MSTMRPRSAFDTVRSNTRPDLTWYLRHRDVLARWPVLREPWAASVEAHREADGAPRRGAPPSTPSGPAPA